MFAYRILGLTCCSFALLCCLQAQQSTNLAIGLSKTHFRDLPIARLATKPFEDLVRSQTGLTSTVTMHADSAALVQQLEEGHLQLAVFQGFEFAWLVKSHPKLKPLVISVPKSKEIRVVLLVRADSNIEDVKSLGKADVTIPEGTRDHCILFWEQTCKRCKLCAQLCSERSSVGIEDAIEDLVEGNHRAVLLEEGAWLAFEKNKPGRAKRLKVLERSDPFPSGVIAYHSDHANESILNKSKAGLMDAQHNTKAKVYLNILKLDSFAPANDTFYQLLEDCNTRYPEHFSNSLKVRSEK